MIGDSKGVVSFVLSGYNGQVHLIQATWAISSKIGDSKLVVSLVLLGYNGQVHVVQAMSGMIAKT